MKKKGWKAAALMLGGVLVLGQAFPAFGAERTSSEADAPDKSQTVRVKADASGKTQEITVENVLKNPGGSARIEDFSTLKDIKNTKGDEEFTQKSDGTILWDNNGEDIQYKGTADEELPVSVKVSYYLDDKEMTPEEIAGKSGEVRIRFDYENHTSETVETDGKEVEVQVPFAVLSAVFLPGDVFSNVEVTNGKLVSMDGQNAVIGYAFPGLSDSLKLADYEPTEDADIPDYVEVTADVSEFELEFTATVVTNGIFADMEDEDFEDMDEIVDSMSDFTDASSKLVEGAAELFSGMETMETYLSEYTKGVSAVNEGAKALSDGLDALNQQKDALESGAAALAQGIETLNTALTQSDIMGQMQSLAVQMASYAGTVQSLVSAADSELEAMDLAGVENTANEKAREQAAAAADAALAQIEGLTDEQKAQIRDSIAASIDVSGVTGEAQEHLALAQKQLEQVPVFEPAEMSPDSSGDVSALLDSLQQLESGSGQLSEGIAAFNQGVEQLYNGSAALNDGTQKLEESGGALNTGMGALSDGMKALRDGISTFDEEGVQELGKLAGDDLAEVITRLKALKEADSNYDNFAGIREGQTGSVRFVIETETVE